MTLQPGRWPVGSRPDVFRKHCVWPGCGWWHDFAMTTPRDRLNAVLRSHLDEKHPGWTLEIQHALMDAVLREELEKSAPSEHPKDWDIWHDDDKG